MATVTNGTDAPIVANVSGTWYTIDPGQSVADLDPRDALSLGEYGLTVEDRRDVILEQDVPVTPGETRFTGGRQFRSDDPRENPPGTPVTETGDTGSNIVTPTTQGVTADEHEAGDPNAVKGDPPADDAELTGDEPWQLKGEALDTALEALNLSKSGTADEKRARLREALEG